MTVAEAIEMKHFIDYSEAVVNTIESAHSRTRKEYEAARLRVKERLDKLAMEV